MDDRGDKHDDVDKEQSTIVPEGNLLSCIVGVSIGP